MSSGIDDLSTQNKDMASGAVGTVRDAEHTEHRRRAMLDLFRENAILIADEDSLGGVMARGQDAFNKHNKTLEEQRRRKQADNTLELITLLDQQASILREEIAALNRQIETLETEIEDLTDESEALQDLIDDIDQAIEKFDRDGEFDLDQDGRFQNEKIEEALQDYERENGPVDRENYYAVLDALNIVQDEIRTQKQKLENVIDQKRSKREQLEEDKANKKRDLDDVESQKDRIKKATMDIAEEEGLSIEKSERASDFTRSIFGSTAPELGSAFSASAVGEENVENIEADIEDELVADGKPVIPSGPEGYS